MKRIMLTNFEPLHPRCIADASEITPRCPLHHVQKVLIFQVFRKQPNWCFPAYYGEAEFLFLSKKV